MNTDLEINYIQNAVEPEKILTTQEQDPIKTDISNLKTPVNILLQPMSKITKTGVAGPPSQPMEKSTNVTDMSVKEIASGVSNSIIGILDDLFTKPDSESWISFLQEIIGVDKI